MKNKYISIKCPSCMSISQIKARSMRSDIFFCPVCEVLEKDNPAAGLETQLYEHRVSMEIRVPVTV
jgi:hypothetical protein